MAHTMASALRDNFLGNSPDWYKLTIIGFLIVNPLLVLINPHLAGWVLVAEFIFTLAMALKCYPLQPGGLLALQAILMGLASPENVLHEAEKNFEVIMLLMFMVASIYFVREMLLYVFTKILSQSAFTASITRWRPASNSDTATITAVTMRLASFTGAISKCSVRFCAAC